MVSVASSAYTAKWGLAVLVQSTDIVALVEQFLDVGRICVAVVYIM